MTLLQVNVPLPVHTPRIVNIPATSKQLSNLYTHNLFISA